MVDKTIPDLPDATAALLDHPFESVEGGVSVKLSLAQMRGVAVVPVTTGAAPVDVGPDSFIAFVTSGGTAGAEVLNIVNPSLNIDGYFNVDYIGSRITVIMAAQTDPADEVHITLAGSADVDLFPVGFVLAGVSGVTDVSLQYLGAAASFVWVGDSWKLDFAYTSRNYNATSVYANIGMSAGATQNIGITAQAGDVTVESFTGDINTTAVNTTVVATGSGAITLQSDLGAINIDPQNSLVKILSIPSSDPSSSGALYQVAGVLHISL